MLSPKQINQNSKVHCSAQIITNVQNSTLINFADHALQLSSKLHIANHEFEVGLNLNGNMADLEHAPTVISDSNVDRNLNFVHLPESVS